jgi:RNA polymerase sigma factor (sigma-70 family)
MSYKGVKEAVEKNDTALLIDQFEGYIHKTAHTLIKPPNYNKNNYDELVSVGKLAILRAYDKFDRVKYSPAQFLMYCNSYIKGSMNNEARKIWAEEVDHASIYATIGSNEDGQGLRTLGDTLTSSENVLEGIQREDIIARINSLLENYSDTERMYLKLYFEDGVNPRKISEKLNIPKNEIRGVIYKTLSKLRKELKENN